MDLTLLSTFADVVRRGSFAAVARDRDTDASSISRAVAALEGSLGVRLFQRTTRRLALTEAGSAYYERVVPLLEGLAAANAEVTDLGDQPLGTVRVTASVAFGQRVVVPMLPEFLARHPGLGVDLVLSDTVLDVVGQRIDLAIRLGTLPDSDLVATKLASVTYRVVASSAYLSERGCPTVPAELAGHDCLRFGLAGFRDRWRFRQGRGEAASAFDIPVSGRVVISNGLALQSCALAGLGVALLPCWLVDDAVRAGQLVDMFPGWEVSGTDFANAVWLVFPTRAYVPRKTRAFVDALQAWMHAMRTCDRQAA
jgi:DNA-binding transcriptional LysR family regulator